MSELAIGGRRIGPGQPCYVIAEVGVNHNGDMDLAVRAIQAAAAAGADAVKFQNFRTEDFIADPTLTYTYQSQGRPVTESQWDMFKRLELPRESLARLKQAASAAGIAFFSTPSSRETLDDLLAVGVPALKNGSDYLGHLPLIRAMAATGLPTILSTGMATLSEVDEAVRAFRGAGGQDLVVLHCVSSYPAAPDDLNLRRIHALAQALDCPVGFSDHSEGVIAAAVAVGLGACMVEKHFTLDKRLPGPDHWFSCDPPELAALVAAVRRAGQSLGDAAIRPARGEAAAREAYRLSCVAAEALEPGPLAEADIAFMRPGHGFRPRDAALLVGRRLVCKVPRGHVFSPEDFA